MACARGWSQEETEEDGDSSKGSQKLDPTPKISNPNGVMAKLGEGFRYFWSTRQMVDTGDSDVKIRTTLRELIIYIVFLLILCIMTFGSTSTEQYNYNQVMSNLFLTAQTDHDVSWTSLTSIEDVWNLIQGPILNNLYPHLWYNNQNFSDDEIGFIMNENRMLGVPRLRQVRVRNNSCIIPDDFLDLVKECYDSYTDATEFKHAFGLMNGTAWTFHTESQLKSSSYPGDVATYSGGGFAQDLALTLEESTALLQPLYENLWIDRGTRAVLIDFTVYNANINLFCVIRLVAEMPPTGGAFPSYSFQTVKLLKYVTPLDYFCLACEIFFALFLVYYVIEEILEIRIHKLSYFKNFWNILDVVNLLIGFCCLIFDVYRTVSVNNSLDKLLENPSEFANFVFLSTCQTMANDALALMLFFCWIKIFKYITFNRSMNQMSSTLSKCAKDLAGFAVMFFIFFLAFAQLGYLLFGTVDPDYNALSTSLITLFRTILGDFNFQGLLQANRVFGPVFFILFIFFVFFILLNMFLAIINDTYCEVKSDMAEAENEMKMGEYFKQGAMKMMDKLNIKHKKMVDIQAAVKEGDTNNDGIVDIDEWRHDMRKRGYGDAEIEAVFAKYDTDGSNGLDASEQKLMTEDLERQKLALEAKLGGGEENEGEISNVELDLLKKRVSGLERTVTTVDSKANSILIKLESMERVGNRRNETIGGLIDTVKQE